MILTEMDSNQTTKRAIAYPSFARRLRAAVLDAIIFLSLFFGLGFLFSRFDFSGGLKATLFAVVILMLEPGLVCLTGGTIGHHALGLKIQDSRTGNHLNPIFAFIRFLMKFVVGWLSFAFILVTKRHQAIHDILSRSVVIIRNPTGRDGLGEQPERQIYLAEFDYPVWYRRVVVILFYVGTMMLLLGLFFVLLFSEGCINRGQCSPVENLLEVIVSVASIGASIGLLYFGWTGRLPGARRKARKSP